MKRRILNWPIRRPKSVYAVVLLATMVLGAMLPLISVDTDPENMLPADQTDRVFHNQVESLFGLHDAIVVGAVNSEHPNGIYNPRSLAALKSLTDDILAMDGVLPQDLMSLSVVDNVTQTGQGAIRFEWLMREAPETQEAALRIREAVSDLPLLNNTLVSADGRAAAVYVPIESKDLSYPLSLSIQELSAQLDSNDQYFITGLPVAEDTFGHEMFVQMAISAPLAGLMIFLLMWYFFRSLRLVIAPMIVAMVTVIATMGLLIGMGFTVHIMSSMIPIFLMPIAVVDSVHIMSEFADRHSAGDDAGEVMAGVVDHLFTPMLYTSLTSAAGFASLMLTPIPPVQVFGAFVASGILLAFVLTLLFIPAYVVRMKPAALRRLKAPESDGRVNTPLARLLRRGAAFTTRRGKVILTLTLLAIVIAVLGILRIEINDNPVRWFKDGHRIRVADQVLNEHFAGTYDAFLVLQVANSQQEPEADDAFAREAERILADMPPDLVGRGRDLLAPVRPLDDTIRRLDDALFEARTASEENLIERLLEAAESAQVDSRVFQRPSVLRYIAALQSHLGDLPQVGKTNALPDVVKVVNRELRSGEPEDYRIPESTPGVAQTLLQYQSSHRPQDLWHMVTPDFRHAAIWLQLESGDNRDMSAVIDALQDWMDDNPPPPGIEARWAGKTYINVVWQEAMVAGMLKSLLGAFVMVLIMMVVLFRSIAFGLIAMLPLSLTIALVYGLVGWVGKYYDMPIAVLSALTLGLSVDFAIHFTERLRALYRTLGDFRAALARVFEEPARAISRNAIVIAVGFTPLLFAPLVPYMTVGAFLAAIMAISAVVTLLLMPTVFNLFNRTLFKPGTGDENPAPQE